MHYRSDVKPGEYFEFEGNVTIQGSVGKKACIRIKNGSLIVEGDVEDRSNIKINTQEISFWQKIKNMFFQTPITSNLHIEGNVGNNVKFVIEGSILIGGDIKNYSIINALNGDIHAGNIGIGSQLTSCFGSVHCMKVDREAKISTFLGQANTSDNLAYKNSIFDFNCFSQLLFSGSITNTSKHLKENRSNSDIVYPNRNNKMR